MKSLGVVFLFLMAVRIAAAADQAATASEVQRLKLIKGDPPVFPHDMMQIGVREGEAHIAFSVDTEGRVDDCLPIAYTNPEFARVSVGALKRWRFEPARFRGQPVAAVSDLTVKFEVEGTVVVSLTSAESMAALMHSMLGEEEYRPRTLKEIDRIPAPINAPSPLLPARLAKTAGPAHVTVSFFIDETGVVRLPSVDVADDPDLGAAAIDAVRQWKFEPPTMKGRPVLVRASQRFNFHSPATPAAPQQTSG